MPESKAKRAARNRRYYETRRKKKLSTVCAQCGFHESKMFEHDKKTLCSVCYAHLTMRKGDLAVSHLIRERQELHRNIILAEVAEEGLRRECEDGRPVGYGLDSLVHLALAVSRNEAVSSVKLGLDRKTPVITSTRVEDVVAGIRERERLIAFKIDDYTAMSFEEVMRTRRQAS